MIPFINYSEKTWAEKFAIYGFPLLCEKFYLNKIKFVFQTERFLSF